MNRSLLISLLFPGEKSIFSSIVHNFFCSNKHSLLCQCFVELCLASGPLKVAEAREATGTPHTPALCTPAHPLVT